MVVGRFDAVWCCWGGRRWFPRGFRGQRRKRRVWGVDLTSLGLGLCFFVCFCFRFTAVWGLLGLGFCVGVLGFFEGVDVGRQQ